jgi:glucose/mannose transport system substrate-binding protein
MEAIVGRRMNRRTFLQLGLAAGGGVLVGSRMPTLSPATLATALAAQGGKLEIFSWWTSGGEVEALDALYAVFKKDAPAVQIVNAALAGGTGAGGNMKAVLKTRMLGGTPPDSFQVHLGHELIDTWAKTGYMEPLDSFYQEWGLTTTFPKQLLGIASWSGHQWSVPVNIHRANILWYNTKILRENGLEPPKTFDQFFSVAEKLKQKGIPAMAHGEASPGRTGHVFEAVLIGTLGAEGYKGLWTGATPWSSPKVTDALNTVKRMLEFANPDYLSIQWPDSWDLIVEGKAAMEIDGDWVNGFFTSKKFADYGWMPAPQTEGIYDTLSDSFGLPKHAPDRENAIAWLKVCGSLDGQDAFNPLKGSIPARLDAGKSSTYNPYQRWALAQWKKDTIVPSVVHGFAAKESWVTDYVNAMNVFATRKDVAATQKQLVQICSDAGVCK